ncbi:MAG TPA: FecR domain-containing protein [Gemmatimonadaceae bacterium]|nr:FecR domain-containing protein [Gemmatimonadaceae bacterium]
MSDTFDWRILDRHLASDASPDDERALAAWLADDPRNAEVVSAARAAAHGSDGRLEPRWNVDRAWSRVAARMHEAHDGSVVSLHPRRSVRPWTRRSRTRLLVLAVGALTAAALLLVVVVRRPATHGPGSAIASRTHEVLAARAQQTRATLGDGTRIVLNAGSRLRYSDDFGRRSRDVELDGEAYFDVVHDEARPFRVHARGSIAEDVGTRFVVRAYSDQAAVEVVVTQGSVVLRPERPFTAPMVLVAGQRGRVAPDGAITLVNEEDVERWLEWTRGGIVLEGVTLGDAAVELGRRFDARIEVAGEDLARRTVSARFHNEPLPRVLDALGAALGARWTRIGDRIVIARSE